MLSIHINGGEFFIDKTSEFKKIKPVDLQLEHSLVSISKWEAKWEKPFLGKEEKTKAELTDYIRCMTVSQNIDPYIYVLIANSDEQMALIKAYIEAPMTATKISQHQKQTGPKEIITSELIYYWMIANNIPQEYQKWHLNRLLTLIEVCGVKNAPPKKMSARELANQNAALNAARRKAMGSKG